MEEEQLKAYEYKIIERIKANMVLSRKDAIIKLVETLCSTIEQIDNDYQKLYKEHELLKEEFNKLNR